MTLLTDSQLRPPSVPPTLSSTGKPIVYIPSPLHPVATQLALDTFDVLFGYNTSKVSSAAEAEAKTNGMNGHEANGVNGHANESVDERNKEWWKYADGVVLRVGQLPAEEVEQAKRLRIISRNGVGYETVPLDICRANGIVATNLPGSNAASVAELALTLTLSLLRRVVELDRRMRRGEFLPNIDWLAGTLGKGADGKAKVVGLVGMGHISREFAKLCWNAFQTDIIVYSPTSSPHNWTGTSSDPTGSVTIPHTRVDTLRALLERSDVVSLHCPQIDDYNGKRGTVNMMSTEQFGWMKKGGILINTARGGLIDEPALIKALKEGEIAGAALDVLVHEPGTLDNYAELYALENVVVTPHAGAGTHAVQIKSCSDAVNSVASFLKGEGVGGSNRLL